MSNLEGRRRDEGEQPSSFHKSEASNRFFFLCGMDQMSESAGFNVNRWGSFFQREENVIIPLKKKLWICKLKGTFLCLFSCHFYLIITSDDSAVFTHGDMLVAAGCVDPSDRRFVMIFSS